MTDLKKRLTIGILGLAMTFALVACDSADRPDNTTPGEPSTTEPVGS